MLIFGASSSSASSSSSPSLIFGARTRHHRGPRIFGASSSSASSSSSPSLIFGASSSSASSSSSPSPSSSSIARTRHHTGPIDLVDLFDAPLPLPAAAASSSSAAAASSSSAPASSPSATQQVTLDSVLHNVFLGNKATGEISVCVEAVQLDTVEWNFLGAGKGGVRNCCFSADSNFLITYGHADGIRLWDPSTRALVSTLKIQKSTPTALVSFHLNGKVLVAYNGLFDDTIRISELASGIRVANLKCSAYVCSLMYCARQNVLISGQFDGSVDFWSASDWQRTDSLRVSSRSSVVALSLSCDGANLAIGCSNGAITIWGMSSRKRAEWKVEGVTSHMMSGLHLSFSSSQPDMLLVTANDGRCRCFNVATQLEVGSVPSTSDASNFSRSGRFFVTATGSQPERLALFDSQTMLMIQELDACSAGRKIASICFSPDGSYLACTTVPNAPGATPHFHIWESPLRPVRSIIPASGFPKAANGFRLAPLSATTCLVVVRLSSGEWTVATMESTAAKVTMSDWSLLPSTLQHPIITVVRSDGTPMKAGDIVSFVGADEKVLKVEDKQLGVRIPFFVAKNAQYLMYSYASSLSKKEADAKEKQEAAMLQPQLSEEDVATVLLHLHKAVGPILRLRK